MTIALEASVSSKDLRALRFAMRELPKRVRNKIIRQETRKALKETVLQPSRSAVPVDSGNYRKSVKVRAIRRSRKYVGTRVASGDKAFTGQAFYGGFLEWGWHAGANRVPIMGELYLTRVAERKGPIAADVAARRIGNRIVMEWRKL